MGLIISASRRTDIPAFYAKWFMNRVRAGFCDVPNPVNPRRVTRVSLNPDDVDAVVFWTRNAEPLAEHLDELDRRGFRYYFQYTLLDNPKDLDPGCPGRGQAVRTFLALSDRIGPERVIWRYDPIALSDATPASRHLENFRDLAAALRGRTRRVVISLLDMYPFVEKRLKSPGGKGMRLASIEGREADDLVADLARTAEKAGLEIVGCAESDRLERLGVPDGRCIDNALIEHVFKIRVTDRKDPGQRRACRCVASRDIGAYDTCPAGCVYCYATRDAVRARVNFRNHNPEAFSLVDSLAGSS